MTEKIIVDGVMLEIKIIEEWGFNMGEDACLFEEDEKSVVSCPEDVKILNDMEANHNVDVLVDKIARDLEETVVIYGKFDNNDRCEMVDLETKVPVKEPAFDVLRRGIPDSPKKAIQEDDFVSNVLEQRVFHKSPIEF